MDATPRPPHGRPPLHSQGLALRFALIIGDTLLADALHVSCLLDTIAVHFPETHILIDLTRLPPGLDASVLLEYRAEHHPTGALGRRPDTRWQRVLPGRPGSPQQREHLLREILSARTPTPHRTLLPPAPTALRLRAAAI